MAISKATAEAWLKITIERLKANIHKLKIGSSGDLENSLHGFVKAQAGGDVQLIQIFYNWYGSMVELGVGKGVSLSGASEERKIAKLVGGKARKPKPWKQKEIAFQTKRLAEILEKNALKQIDDQVKLPDSLMSGLTIEF